MPNQELSVEFNWLRLSYGEGEAMIKRTSTDTTSEIDLKNVNLHTNNDLKVLRRAIVAITDNLQRKGQPKTRYREITVTRLQEAGLWLTMEIHKGVKL